MWLGFLLLVLLLGFRRLAHGLFWIALFAGLLILGLSLAPPSYHRVWEPAAAAAPAIAPQRVYVATPEPALPDPLLDPLFNLVPLGR